jgi:hypothetical protein
LRSIDQQAREGDFVLIQFFVFLRLGFVALRCSGLVA